MAPETREWSVPAPVRMLLWWPAISFVLVVVDPEAATGEIVIAGAALAVLGGLLAAAARTLRGRRPQVVEPEMPLDMPTMEIPQVDGTGRRAA